MPAYFPKHAPRIKRGKPFTCVYVFMCMHTYVYILYVITDNYVYYTVKIYNYIYLKRQKSSCLWKNILPEKNIRL